MRNWNLGFRGPGKAPAWHCQPTYEELKLILLIIFSQKLLDCQPTYEELKQSSLFLCLAKPCHCQPTYEELKHGLLDDGPENLQRLPAYLWGIETRIIFLDIGKGRIIASLPMRNWNLAQGAVFEKPTRIASLPMRNWNRNKSRVGRS